MNNEVDFSRITGQTDTSSLSIQNNYRFDALIRAIDFFSQKFNLETLVDFAGDFINEILTLNSSAVFVYDESEDCFAASKIRLYKSEIKKIPNSKKLQDIARLYGSIITSNFTPFFSEKFIQAYKPSLLIPLIHNDGLLGFIVTNGKALGEFDEDDYSMAKALMLLFNNAFERNYYVEEIERNRNKIDKLSFELYAANKTLGILFDEKDPKKLLEIGLDVFSEVSGSRTTSFAVSDGSGQLAVKACRNLEKLSPAISDFCVSLVDGYTLGDKVAFETTAEIDELKKIFKNPEQFSELNAEYVIIVAGDRISGFVTLGKQKAAAYTKETLSVVSMLARELETRYRMLGGCE